MAVIEKAEIQMAEGREDSFFALIREKGTPLLAAVEGVGEIRIGRGVEDPSKLFFLVEWESVEAHLKWQGSEGSTAFRSLFAGNTVGGSMEHIRFE